MCITLFIQNGNCKVGHTFFTWITRLEYLKRALVMKISIQLVSWMNICTVNEDGGTISNLATCSLLQGLVTFWLMQFVTFLRSCSMYVWSPGDGNPNCIHLIPNGWLLHRKSQPSVPPSKRQEERRRRREEQTIQWLLCSAVEIEFSQWNIWRKNVRVWKSSWLLASMSNALPYKE